jgi:hypothetical protein
MSRHHNYGVSPHASSASASHSFNPSAHFEKHDEHASQSGSEDGNYALYPDTPKIEAENEGARIFCVLRMVVIDQLLQMTLMPH